MRARTIAGWVLAAAMAVAAMQVLAQKDEGPILLPKKPPAKPASPTLLVVCDLACNWKLDGAAQGRIEAGASAKVKVDFGQHLVAAATEDGLDKAEKQLDVKETGLTLTLLELAPVRAARLKAEQEAREKSKPSSPTFLVMCDLACDWKLDGEAKGRIDAGGSVKAKVEMGQHVVVAATADGLDKLQQLTEVKAAEQIVVNLELAPVRDARLKAEQEAKDKEAQEAKAKAEQEAKDKEAQEAKAKAEQEARDQAAREQAAQQQQQREQKPPEQPAQVETAGPAWTDPATNLMWTKKDNGADVDWQRATEYCSNLQLAGHSDWRLPSIDELQGIYDPGANVDGWAVKGDIHLFGWQWSGSKEDDAGKAWAFYFIRGLRISAPLGDSTARHALCVRPSADALPAANPPEAVPSPSVQPKTEQPQVQVQPQMQVQPQVPQQAAATDTSGPAWIDPATNLMWTKKDNGADVDWQQATEYCRNLQLAGHSDWRLPSIDELQGIYDPNANVDGWAVKGDLHLFGWQWSSSQEEGAGKAWAFYFIHGLRTSGPLGDSKARHALCVRPSGE